LTVLLSPKARKYLARNSKPHFSFSSTKKEQAGKFKLKREKIYVRASSSRSGRASGDAETR
jgi:hypothetical protein